MKLMKRTIAILAAALTAGQASAVEPVLNQTVPLGGQRGKEVEVRLQGARLDDAKEVLFYGPGISVVKLEPVMDKDKVRDNEVRATFKIAPDCRLGEHALRVRTATGLTGVQTFRVGPFAGVEEKEPNNEFARAQKIDLNVTVEGRVESEDVDYYLVEAKKGQRLSVEVEGIRLGYSMWDSYVAIQDMQGRVIAENDDAPLFVQDSTVSAIAPEDGTYIVQVRESSYGGGSRNYYRAHIGAFPRPLAAYPAGGKEGEAVKVKFIGDSAGAFEHEVKPSAQTGGVEVQRDGLFTPSALPFRVSTLANVLEAEPNDELKTATATETVTPVALNGILEKAGDADWFKFKAKKGQNLDVHVYARRIGSPLDPVLNIYNATGGNIAGNDDSAGADSYLRFTVPDDGYYHLRVGDHLNRGGATHVYRVELVEAVENIVLSVPHVARFDSQGRQAMVIPRGGHFATLIGAERNNSRGDLEFYAKDLPPGVTLHADPMPGNQNQFLLVFSATPDAPVGGRIGELLTRVVDKDNKREVKTVRRQMLDLVMAQPNNQIYYQTSVDGLAVAVTEEAPFNVRIVEPKAPLAQYGTMDLKIVVDRKEGFNEDVQVELPYRPPGLSANPRLTIPKGQGEGKYTLNSSASAEVRKWNVAVLATAPVKGGNLWLSSPLAPLQVVERYVLGKFDAATTERGKSVKVVCKLEQKIPFEGKATVELLGLPSNTTAEKREITKDTTEVVFDVVTTEKSPAGLHKQLFCSLELTVNGEPVKHTVATSGLLRIDAPKPPEPAAPKVAKTASAK
jgi:hypothetical protein